MLGIICVDGKVRKSPALITKCYTIHVYVLPISSIYRHVVANSLKITFKSLTMGL